MIPRLPYNRQQNHQINRSKSSQESLMSKFLQQFHHDSIDVFRQSSQSYQNIIEQGQTFKKDILKQKQKSSLLPVSEQNFSSQTESLASLYQKTYLNVKLPQKSYRRQQKKTVQNRNLNTVKKGVRCLDKILRSSDESSGCLKQQSMLSKQKQILDMNGRLSTIEEIYPQLSKIFDQVNYLQDRVDNLEVQLQNKQELIKHLRQQLQQNQQNIRKVTKNTCSISEFQELNQKYTKLQEMHQNFIFKTQNEQKQLEASRLEKEGHFLWQIHTLKQKIRGLDQISSTQNSSQDIEAHIKSIVKQAINENSVNKSQECKVQIKSLKGQIQRQYRQNNELKRQVSQLSFNNRQLNGNIEYKESQIKLLRQNSQQANLTTKSVNKVQTPKQLQRTQTPKTFTTSNGSHVNSKEFYQKLLNILKENQAQQQNKSLKTRQYNYTEPNQDLEDYFKRQKKTVYAQSPHFRGEIYRNRQQGSSKQLSRQAHFNQCGPPFYERSKKIDDLRTQIKQHKVKPQTGVKNGFFFGEKIDTKISNEFEIRRRNESNKQNRGKGQVDRSARPFNQYPKRIKITTQIGQINLGNENTESKKQLIVIDTIPGQLSHTMQRPRIQTRFEQPLQSRRDKINSIISTSVFYD